MVEGRLGSRVHGPILLYCACAQMEFIMNGRIAANVLFEDVHKLWC